jgi:DNA-directed RNA polymerase specialized sigma24 family protein
LQEVIARDEKVLLGQARRHCRRPDDVEEALQRSYLLFLERYDDRCHPLGWLQTTVKREAWGIARRAHRHRERGFEDFRATDGSPCDLSSQLPDDAPPLAEQLQERIDLQKRLQLLSALKPDERTALLLVALGYSYREIADLRDWILTKVNRCIAEGRATLRSMSPSDGATL